ncbi:MAG: hypothetical protein A2W28_07695 [Gammaproteobacteria bacterium RBG_16_51_14]|nr:MAG: hypothetical protein A2W28_07695 [Gammaproteobacteria bacterium RBG_16_51_14]
MSILFPYHGVIRGSLKVPEARLISCYHLPVLFKSDPDENEDVLFKGGLNNSVPSQGGTGALHFSDHDKIAWTISSGMKLDIPKGCREGELQGGYSSTILNSAQALARRAHTMEGMRKSKNAIIALSHISMAYQPLERVVPPRAAETMN